MICGLFGIPFMGYETLNSQEHSKNYSQGKYFCQIFLGEFCQFFFMQFSTKIMILCNFFNIKKISWQNVIFPVRRLFWLNPLKFFNSKEIIMIFFSTFSRKKALSRFLKGNMESLWKDIRQCQKFQEKDWEACFSKFLRYNIFHHLNFVSHKNLFQGHNAWKKVFVVGGKISGKYLQNLFRRFRGKIFKSEKLLFLNSRLKD